MADTSIPARLPPLRPTNSSSMLVRIGKSGETIRLLTGAQLKSGNRDKMLGHLWSLLDPLLALAVYYLIFGIGFRQAGDSPQEFVLYLFIGIVVWRFFSESVSQAAGCLRSHRGLILASDFPKAVIPISICFARAYDLAWALLIVLGVAALNGVTVTSQIAWLPFLFAVHFILTLGCALLVSYIGLFFADTANLVGAGLRLWVLASPIFYFARSEHGRTGIIPPNLIDYYMLNPIAGLLDAYRSALIWHETPNLGELGYVTSWAVIALAIGLFAFSRGDGTFAKYV